MKKDKAKIKKEKKPKPQYNMAQNTAYMLGMAWKTRKSVLWYSLLLVCCAVGLDLVNLFTVPTVIARVENSAPLRDLLLTILLFAGSLILLRGLNAYVQSNTLFGRIEVRMQILRDINKKQAMTSYPNTEDESINKKLSKAQQATGDNSQATEAVWNTFTGLLQKLIGFTIYLFLLSALDPFLIVVMLLFTVAAFFLNRKAGEWDYQHREESAKFNREYQYVNERAGDVKLAKDIRLFGMRD